MEIRRGRLAACRKKSRFGPFRVEWDQVLHWAVHMRSGTFGYAWRGMRRTPGVLAVVVLTLALGIGGATAMFAVVDAVLLNPLPYPNGDRLLEVFLRQSPTDQSPGLDARTVDALRRQTRAFSAVEGYRMGAATLTDGDPSMVAAPTVSLGLLHMLGAAPRLGRLFAQDEAVRGDAVALISERLWRTRFGSAPDVVGRRFGVDGVPHLIVGVLPARFSFPERTADVWRPLRADANTGAPERGWVVAFLRPEVTREAAAEVLRAVSASLVAEGVLPADSSVVFAEAVQRRFGARYRTELSGPAGRGAAGLRRGVRERGPPAAGARLGA